MLLLPGPPLAFSNIPSPLLDRTTRADMGATRATARRADPGRALPKWEPDGVLSRWTRAAGTSAVQKTCASPGDDHDAPDTLRAIDQLYDHLRRFRLTSFTVDQFNGRAIADGLRGLIREHPVVDWGPMIDVDYPTRSENYQRAETFKRLAYAGHLRSPENPAARDELLNLRDNHGRVEAPTSGRITHDDLAIAMINIVAILA